jgi:hypothetical protein
LEGKLISVITTKNFDPLTYSNIDPTKNIIIYSRADHETIDEQPDGSINILATRPITIPPPVTKENPISKISEFIHLKISTPSGILLLPRKPSNVNYYSQFSLNYESYIYRDERTKEIEYTIFEKFEITIDIHVTKMRDSISRVTIDKKDVLVNVGFVPGIGLEGKVEGIYWIRNNELYSRI